MVIFITQQIVQHIIDVRLCASDSFLLSCFVSFCCFTFAVFFSSSSSVDVVVVSSSHYRSIFLYFLGLLFYFDFLLRHIQISGIHFSVALFPNKTLPLSVRSGAHRDLRAVILLYTFMVYIHTCINLFDFMHNHWHSITVLCVIGIARPRQ